MDEDSTIQWDEAEMSDETIQSLISAKASSLEVAPPPEPPSFVRLALDNALSPEQRAILKLVESGRSIFFTGSAGMLRS